MALTANTYSGIKSIQRGSININGAATTGTSTVTAVVPGKSFLTVTQNQNVNTLDACYVVLTNATTITATRNTSGNMSIVTWELVEWY